MENNELSKLWEKRLKNYEKSNKSVTTWCRENSVTKSQFYYWRNKLHPEQKGQVPSVKWLPLDITNNNEKAILSENSITVQIGEAKIEIKKGFDQKLFLEIVKVLKTI